VNGDMQGRKRRKYQYTAFDLVKRCYGIHHRYLSSVGLSDPAMCLSDKLYSQLSWTPALSLSPSKRSLFPQLWMYSDNKLVTCWTWWYNIQLRKLCLSFGGHANLTLSFFFTVISSQAIFISHITFSFFLCWQSRLVLLQIPQAPAG